MTATISLYDRTKGIFPIKTELIFVENYRDAEEKTSVKNMKLKNPNRYWKVDAINI